MTALIITYFIDLILLHVACMEVAIAKCTEIYKRILFLHIVM